jgi:hypothetical protein
LSDYLSLAWFVSSLATIGGGLGVSLESDVAVREAAYAYRRKEDASPADGEPARIEPSGRS